MKIEWVKAALVLGLVLNVVFFPALWGNKTLLMSSWDASSIMPSGAYDTDPVPSHVGRTPDAGAPAWTIEPWFKIISNQYWSEHELPLWNPNSAYGTPLAADMQSQPFYPLAVLLALHPTALTYNFFIVGRLFVAGLLMFLFARLFLDFIASLIAAMTFMLTGYFIIYLNMPHLSVEVLLPGIFLGFELLLRQNSWKAVIGAAGIIFLCVTGGMPESLFLAVSFGCLYFFFQIAVTPEFRERPLARLGKLAAAVALGFALSAFLLFPFLEFMKIAHDTHQAANLGNDMPGSEFDGDPRVMIIHLLPLIFGRVVNSIFLGLSGWTGMRGYWGITPCLFAIAAVLCCFARKNIAYPRRLRFLTAFFGVSLVLMVFKRFGSPIINWIGLLPLGDMIEYVKYQESLMAFCVATLAGIGFSLLCDKQTRSGYFFVAAIALLVVMLALAAWSVPHVLELKNFAFMYYRIVLAGLLIVLAAVILLIVPLRLSWIAWGFFGLLTAELCLNFIVPSFYLSNHLPSVRRSPYTGAPYIDFVRERNRDHYRVFARGGFLYPNWAGVFGLADVRSVDALYYRPYINFVRSFLLKPESERQYHGELEDRFTGSDGSFYTFDTELEMRFLALSSVKYLIGFGEFGSPPSKVLEEIVAQHRTQNLWGLSPDLFQVDGQQIASGLFQHPPSHRVSYKMVVDPNQPIFEGVATIKADAQDKTAGVDFLLEIDTGEKIEKLFSTFLNPRAAPADKAGRPFRLDLSQYSGKEVELLFSTDSGPTGNNAFGWAGWAKLRFVPTKESEQFKKVYNKEVNVYEVARVLPRASLFRAVEVLPEDQVLPRLKDPAFNPEQKVILSQESLSNEDTAAVQSLTKGPKTPSAAASITSYDSQHVRIEADADSSTLLMLNDANYPGWRAYLNGKRVPILKADYLFRGVVLPAGRNVLEFAYEPTSYRLGALVTTGTLASLALVAGLAFRRRRRQPLHPIFQFLKKAA
jgi:membrane protein YfhO